MNVFSMENVWYRGRESEGGGEMMLVRWKLKVNYEKSDSREVGCQEEKRNVNDWIDKMPIIMDWGGAGTQFVSEKKREKIKRN
jgi:hypothetical protein